MTASASIRRQASSNTAARRRNDVVLPQSGGKLAALRATAHVGRRRQYSSVRIARPWLCFSLSLSRYYSGVLSLSLSSSLVCTQSVQLFFPTSFISDGYSASDRSDNWLGVVKDYDRVHTVSSPVGSQVKKRKERIECHCHATRRSVLELLISLQDVKKLRILPV